MEAARGPVVRAVAATVCAVSASCLVLRGLRPRSATASGETAPRAARGWWWVTVGVLAVLDSPRLTSGPIMWSWWIAMAAGVVLLERPSARTLFPWWFAVAALWSAGIATDCDPSLAASGDEAWGGWAAARTTCAAVLMFTISSRVWRSLDGAPWPGRWLLWAVEGLSVGCQFAFRSSSLWVSLVPAAVWALMGATRLVEAGVAARRLSRKHGDRAPDRLPPFSVYSGFTTHSRHLVADHRFTYRIWMALIDVDAPSASCSPDHAPRFVSFDPGSTGEAASGGWLGAGGLFSLSRGDHYGDPKEPMGAAVRATVAEQVSPEAAAAIDRVMLLTNLRVAGHCFNPIALFYCFAADGALAWVVAEVTSTPWHERTLYVVRPRGSTAAKAMHVSPFMAMDHTYHFTFGGPDSDRLSATVALDDVFYATMHLSRVHHPTAFMLAKAVTELPPAMLTLVRIHWQALLLVVRGVPFLSHPKHTSATGIDLGAGGGVKE